MQRISFNKTIEAFRDGRKTVTRRDAATWVRLTQGTRMLAVEKCQGISAGEHQVVLGEIEVIMVGIEPLDRITRNDVLAEGFDHGDPERFIADYIKWFGGDRSQLVRRIEYRRVTE